MNLQNSLACRSQEARNIIRDGVTDMNVLQSYQEVSFPSNEETMQSSSHKAVLKDAGNVAKIFCI